MLRRLFAIDPLSWRLGMAVSAVVVVALAAGFHLTWLVYRAEMLNSARAHAAAEAQLVRLSLTHEMLEDGDRSLTTRMVQGLRHSRADDRIMVLDRRGRVRFSSDPAMRNHRFSAKDPTCTVCHNRPAAQREHSTVIDVDGGTVMRSVQPILNGEACHECHDSSHRINGVLIVDTPVGATIATIESSVTRLAAGTAVVGLLLIGGISLAFRRFLLRRLYRFQRTAAAIAEGDLSQRVAVEGNDALTRLEIAFNDMVDSVTRLLRRVEAQNERQTRIMNAVDDGLLVLDAGMRVADANEAFHRRFSPERPFGTDGHCWECIAPRGVGCDVRDCPAHLSLGDGQVHTAIRTRPGLDGRTHHEEVRASPIRGPDGKLDGVVEVWRDITDRRSAEARLAEYQRLASVGMLASGIAHEVNTPLASIGTCLEAIARVTAGLPDCPDAPLVQNYAQIAQAEVQRCGAITKQFMQLARGRTPDAEILQVEEVAALVVRLAAPTAKVARVTLALACDVALPAVRANSAAIQQVLLNLVINAIEASPPGSTVRVGCQDSGAATIALTVTDDGAGIAPEDLGQVFEPFFSRRARGSGLGLFVSLNLARSWGGDIYVQYSQPGVGSCFAVTFPSVLPHAESEALS